MSHAQKSTKAKHTEASTTASKGGGMREGTVQRDAADREAPGLLEAAGPALRLGAGGGGGGADAHEKPSRTATRPHTGSAEIVQRDNGEEEEEQEPIRPPPTDLTTLPEGMAGGSIRIRSDGRIEIIAGGPDLPVVGRRGVGVRIEQGEVAPILVPDPFGVGESYTPEEIGELLSGLGGAEEEEGRVQFPGRIGTPRGSLTPPLEWSEDPITQSILRNAERIRQREQEEDLEGSASGLDVARELGSRTLDGFAVDDATLTSEHGETLDELAPTISMLLRVKRRGMVFVTGHTDATGAEARNEELSRQRAQAVRDALIARGVPADRIITDHQGASDLRVPVPDAEPRNRRVEIEFFSGRPRGPGFDLDLSLEPPFSAGGSSGGADEGPSPSGIPSPDVQRMPVPDPSHAMEEDDAVQAKVTVGASDDRFEQEADTVAQRVTEGRPAPAISSLPPGGVRPAQRQPTGAETEEEMQRQEEEDEVQDVQRRAEEDEVQPTDSEEEVQRQPEDEGEAPNDLPVQLQVDAVPGADPDDEPDTPVQSSPSDSSRGGGSRIHARAAQAIRGRGSGTPLSPGLRSTVEPLFGHDFGGVRLHTGTEAQAAARSIRARAFTHRNHIWLGDRASTADTSLIAHELTHVVQQGHAPPLHGAGRAASAPTSGVQRASDERAEEEQTATEPTREDDTVQRFSIWGAVKSVGSSVVSGVRTAGQAVADVAGDLMDMGRSALMAVVRRVAPDFARLIERDGLLGLLRSVVRDAFEALFGGVYDTITSAFNFEALREGFSAAVEAVQSVAGRLLEGDASAILDAARNVSTLIGDTLSPVIDTIRSVAETVQEVFGGVMEVVGTPVMDFLGRIGGAVWRGFTGIVEDVGAIFSTVKDALGSAWERVKGWFGITADEGTDEGGGIWGWVKEKAAGVWDRITGFLEPVMGPLRTVGRVLLLLSPAGPALLLYEYWPQLQQAFAWIREQWNDLNIVVRARTYLREQLLPTLKQFLLQVGRGVQQAADWLADNVSSVSSGVDAVLQALGGSALLGPLRSVVQFVQRQFSRASSFVQTTIRTAGRVVRTLFQRLVDWIDPLLGVLRDLVAAVANPFGIPGLLLGGAWRLLPGALKGPIIDFILDLLRGFVRAIPPLPQLGLLWPFLRSGILGFLERMRTFATERKVAVSNKIATIISGGSFSFAVGYLRGLATGLWEAVTGPFYAIAMLFDLPDLIRNFVSMLGELFTGIAEEVRAIIRIVSERAEETLESVLNAARELLENPGMLIDIISGALQAALDAVGDLGASFAERLMGVFEQPDEQLGESLGTLTGNILVEVLLAVFTAGAGNAISGVGRVANLLRRVQRNFQRVLRLVADLMRPVLNFIDRIIDLFRGAMSRVGSVFQRIGQGFNRIVDRFRTLFQRLRGRRAGGAPDVDTPGGPPRAARPDADTTPDVDTTPEVDATPTPRPDVDRPSTRSRGRDAADTDADRRRRRDDDDGESYAEKQARLQRVLARLRPKVYRLLDGGVSQFRLTAKLRYWRARYRLSRLFVDRHGSRFEVVAVINPRGDAGSGYEPRGQELRAIIEEAAEELLDDPRVQAAAQRQREALATPGGGGADEPLEVSGEGFPGLVEQYRRGGGDVPSGSDRYYQVGSDPRHRVSEEGAAGTNAFVRLHPSDYEGINDTIQEIKRTRGLDDADIAFALRRLVQTGEVPAALMASRGTGLTADNRSKLAKVAYLLFGRETVRNPAALAHAPMMLDLVGRGESSFERMLTSRHRFGGGAFPPAFEGASTAAGQLEGREDVHYGRRDSDAFAKRRLLMRREMRIARMWLRSQMETQDLSFTNRHEVKEYVLEHLRRFYIRQLDSNE